MENLAKLINEDDESIGIYLDLVTIDKFKADVKELIKNCNEKELIKQAIKKLQEFI
jgi:hypothetical protein